MEVGLITSSPRSARQNHDSETIARREQEAVDNFDHFDVHRERHSEVLRGRTRLQIVATIHQKLHSVRLSQARYRSEYSVLGTVQQFLECATTLRSTTSTEYGSHKHKNGPQRDGMAMLAAQFATLSGSRVFRISIHTAPVAHTDPFRDTRPLGPEAVPSRRVAQQEKRRTDTDRNE